MIYENLCEELEAMSSGVSYAVSVLSNAAALLYERLPNLNWAGFYLYRDGKLILGPFSGKVACTEIPMGAGVCGTAAERRETLLVPDVHAFSGHIACDSASNSEIVIPLFVRGDLYGVLDLDSPHFRRFTEEDRRGLEHFSSALGQILAPLPFV